MKNIDSCLFIRCILLFITSITVSFYTSAKNNTPETEALYIVPTEPHLIDHSRFKIEIIKPYLNDQTQTISYVFPEILVGEPNRVIEFHKVAGTPNQWESKEAMAYCTITDDIFSCNIVLHKKGASLLKYLVNKAWAQSFVPSNLNFSMSTIHQDKSVDHLKTLNLNPKDLLAFEKVIHSFFSTEPAGILSYEIK